MVAASAVSRRELRFRVFNLAMQKPTAIDIFAGAGGLTEGLRQAGFRVIGAVELDDLACQTYRLNHRRVRLWAEDVRKLPGTTVRSALKLKKGELDLLAACPPCQGFSTMRTKNGNTWTRDVRNDLIFDVLRLVRALLPRAVMIENVPRLGDNQRFQDFRRSLERLGYEVEWDVLDAADFGVPQRRRRLVMLASREARPNFADKVKRRRTVRQFIGDMPTPSRSRDPLHNYPVIRSDKVRALIRKIPKDGGSRSALGRRSQLECHKNFDGYRDVYGRMSWDLPSPTITGGCINPSKGRFLHPSANRAITLREAALLQSFPKSYRFPIAGNRYAVALMIGNALPPEFIRRHALSLRQALDSGE